MKNIINKSSVLNEILNKKILSPADVVIGRKSFISNLEKIEIDITFNCNLKCKCCNRSCGRAPSEERMSLDDIQNFINDSIVNNRKYKLISILGGEPTLHPDFEEIIRIIQNDYVNRFETNTIIQVISNGFIEESRKLCDKVENENKNVCIDRESYKKDNRIDYFTPFCDAPIDDDKFKSADFSKACWVSETCGIGLNKNGYYACSICGGIDRVLKGDGGAKTILELTLEEQRIQFQKFCSLCGNFKYYSSNSGDFLFRSEKAPFVEKISPSWEKIYREYNSGK